MPLAVILIYLKAHTFTNFTITIQDSESLKKYMKE